MKGYGDNERKKKKICKGAKIQSKSALQNRRKIIIQHTYRATDSERDK